VHWLASASDAMGSLLWHAARTAAKGTTHHEQLQFESRAETVYTLLATLGGHGTRWRARFPAPALRTWLAGPWEPRAQRQGKREHTKSGRISWAQNVSTSAVVKFGTSWVDSIVSYIYRPVTLEARFSTWWSRHLVSANAMTRAVAAPLATMTVTATQFSLRPLAPFFFSAQVRACRSSILVLCATYLTTMIIWQYRTEIPFHRSWLNKKPSSIY
jgi:hypothetical protein